MLRHVVIIKFKEEVTNNQINDLTKRLRALPKYIKEIKSYEIGKDVLHLPRSYDYAVVEKFSNVEEQEKYQRHSEHLKVIEFIKPMCANIISVDYEI